MVKTLNVCGLQVERGQKLRTYLPIPDTETQIPLTIINGQNDGPTLLITAGIHGGEYPGIATAMELGRDINPHDICGCLILIHPVNIQSFWARSAFENPADGRNLNREFPGDVNGTLSQKTAHLLSQSFFPLADFYVDMHSGDIHEELHPYVYYPGLPNEELSKKSREVAKILDMQFMVKSMATSGAYNHAAIAGVPSLLIERGGAGFCLREDIDAYKADTLNIMRKLGLCPEPLRPRQYSPIDVTDVIYLENATAGCWLPNFRSGELVKQGDELGLLTDLFGTLLKRYISEQDGVILYQCPTLAAPQGTILVTYGKLAVE